MKDPLDSRDRATPFFSTINDDRRPTVILTYARNFICKNYNVFKKF